MTGVSGFWGSFVLGFHDAEDFSDLLVKEAFARPVGLDPSTVDHKLGNRSLAGMPNHFLGGAWRRFNIDLSERYFVLCQEAFRRAAIGAPEG